MKHIITGLKIMGFLLIPPLAGYGMYLWYQSQDSIPAYISVFIACFTTALVTRGWFTYKII